MSEQTTLPALPQQDGIEFRHVAGFPGYAVGDDGSPWRHRNGAWERLRDHRHKSGYRRVMLIIDDRRYFRLVHRLVLEAFVGPCPDGMEACHYPDQNKANNRLSNLRWDTHAGNSRDAYRDRPPRTEKPCTHCGVTRPLAEFFRDKRSTDGRKGICRTCDTRLTMATSDPEKRRRANREYARRVRERAKKHS